MIWNILDKNLTNQPSVFTLKSKEITTRKLSLTAKNINYRYRWKDSYVGELMDRYLLDKYIDSLSWRYSMYVYLYLISVVWKSTYVKIIQRRITTNKRGLNLDTLIFCQRSIFRLYVILARLHFPTSRPQLYALCSMALSIICSAVNLPPRPHDC